MGKDLPFRNPIKVTQDGVLFKQNARVIFHFKEVSALRKTPYNTKANILTVALVHLLINVMLRCMVQKTFPCHKLSKHAPELSNHERVS